MVLALSVTGPPKTLCLKSWSPVAIKSAAVFQIFPPRWWKILQAQRDLPAVSPPAATLPAAQQQ